MRAHFEELAKARLTELERINEDIRTENYAYTQGRQALIDRRIELIDELAGWMAAGLECRKAEIHA